MSRQYHQHPMAPGSAISKGRGGSLATIKERDEAIRSADPNVSKSRQMAAAAQMPVRNQPSGYNGGAREQASKRVANVRSNNDLGQHRSPVLASGKQNHLLLPPIVDPSKQRVGGVSVSRQDPMNNMRNYGAARMGGANSASAHNLNSYRNDSQHGSNNERDSINVDKTKNYGHH